MKQKGASNSKMKVDNLQDLLSPRSLKLLAANGREIFKEIGLDVVRSVVFNVLTGKNLRDSTELLTRIRIASINLAIVGMFLKGSSASSDFVKKLPFLATETLKNRKLSKSERWLAQWVLGLTDKAFQNVLRDDPGLIDNYRDQYIASCAKVIKQHKTEFGDLKGALIFGPGIKVDLNWLFMTYLCGTVGAQTLAIRGSEKSAYGKLFEKLILGSLLHILGFKFIQKEELGRQKKVFWLSSRNEKRESDATVLFDKGKGVRFDIGFIGRGNPEISLDKVTRFEREISLGRSKWFLGTIIIVDRIGTNSKIESLAKAVKGKIVQMSSGYWPQSVASELRKVLGFKHDLIDMPAQEIDIYLREKINDVPLQDFIRSLPSSGPDQESE